MFFWNQINNLEKVILTDVLQTRVSFANKLPVCKPLPLACEPDIFSGMFGDVNDIASC